MILKYIGAWFPMMLIAIINGAFRETLLLGSLGDLRVHQVSTLILLLMLTVYMGVVLRIMTPETAGQTWAVGFIWLAMTLAFEFGFGHFFEGKPWSDLLKEYDLLAGKVWVLVPVWVTVAPPLFFRLQRR